MPFYIVIGIVMAASFVGMVICAKKQAEFPVAKVVTVLLLAVVMACAAAILVKSLGSGATKQLISSEMTYAKAAANTLGRHLAQEYPGAIALIVVENTNETNEFYLARLESLKAGLSPSIQVRAVVAPDLAAPPPGTEPEPAAEAGTAPAAEVATPAAAMPVPDPMAGLSVRELMASFHFDALIAQNPDCDLIISMIGLPRDADNMALWTMPEETRPKVALLTTGESISRTKAIASGAICATITYSPEAKRGDEAVPPPAEDLQAAFDQRYLLVTTANIEEICAKYPGRIFSQPPRPQAPQP